MTHEGAITLIHELIAAEIELMKKETKRAENRERVAVQDLFRALTGGDVATPEQINNIVGY